MKKFTVLKCCVAILALTVATVARTSVMAQDEAPCPFLDDEIILYHSPSTLANIPVIQNVWSCDEAKEALDILFNKIDEGVEESAQKTDLPDEGLEYLASLLKDSTGESSISRALFSAYFRYIDGVILAVDLPEDCKDVKKIPEGISLTYAFNVDPSPLYVRKWLEEEKDYAIIRENEKEAIGKIFVREDEDIKATIYFGATKVKDMDKYVLIFAGTQEGVEKKVSRFQATNVFLTKRLNGEGLYAEYIFKAQCLENIVKALQDKVDDPNVKSAQDVISRIKFVRCKMSGNGECISWTVTLDTVDSEAAQDIVDLSVGAVAAAKMTTNSNPSLSTEQKLGIEILKNIHFEHNEASASATIDFSSDLLKDAAQTFFWSKIKETVK